MTELRRSPRQGQAMAPAAALMLKLVAGHGVARHGLLRLPPEGCGMARALALGDSGLEAMNWQTADRCRIVLRGEAWLISNHSRRLVCALNGRRIRAGEESLLQAGDTLELGLLRFLVVEADVPHRSNALARLDIRQGASHRAGAAGSCAEDLDDPLARLGDEFVAAATDWLRVDGPDPWRRFDSKHAVNASTLEELCEQARPFASMRDILQPRASIDRVIEGFDAFGALDLAQVSIPEDVLRLFAPDNGPVGAAARLPSLTRREHHAVSIDSAMALGAVRPGDDRAGP